jgi:hypothetical protein
MLAAIVAAMLVPPMDIAAPLEPEPIVQEPEYVEEWTEPAYEEAWYYEEPAYSATVEYTPSDGLNAFTGVNYYDGRTETYYSSNALYHKDTAQWTLDDEGFYRTEEGYYVVAASDMPQGTVFEGSKGECIVLDCGCDYGITDYYVGW